MLSLVSYDRTWPAIGLSDHALCPGSLLAPSHLLSLISYQPEVMANRPHQSPLYRITDADTLLSSRCSGDAQITVGGPQLSYDTEIRSVS